MTEPDPVAVDVPGSLPVGRACFAGGPDNPAGLPTDYEQVGDGGSLVPNSRRRFQLSGWNTQPTVPKPVCTATEGPTS